MCRYPARAVEWLPARGGGVQQAFRRVPVTSLELPGGRVSWVKPPETEMGETYNDLWHHPPPLILDLWFSRLRPKQCKQVHDATTTHPPRPFATGRAGLAYVYACSALQATDAYNRVSKKMHLTSTALSASHVTAGSLGPCCTVDALRWANGASKAIHTYFLRAICACRTETALK